MKTIQSLYLAIATTSPPSRATPWRRLLLTIMGISCSALSPDVRGQCRDGCDLNGNTFLGTNALNPSTTGDFNTAIGSFALEGNSTGKENSASGANTLIFNTTGSRNTATGAYSLYYNNLNNNVGASDNTATGAHTLENNITGSQNTAVGASALFGSTDQGNPNSTGSYNTATGFQSLFSVAGGGANVANGWQALYSNTSGQYNTAGGVSALRQNTTGNNNSAIGTNALYHTNGSNNVALGYAAGQNLTTGSNNIIIGANVLGASGDASITRIGNTSQKKTFVGGIYNKTVASGVSVIVNSSGQLGTVQSSARYKDDIKPMDKTSEAILKLKPVTFRYKEELDPEKIPQFGLIAEEVEKIDPDLVVRDDNGTVMTVRYDAVNAMLLNEFLKEHQAAEELRRTVAKQEQIIAQQKSDFSAQIAQQKQQIETLAAGLQKVSAEIEVEKPSRRVTANH